MISKRKYCKISAIFIVIVSISLGRLANAQSLKNGMKTNPIEPVHETKIEYLFPQVVTKALDSLITLSFDQGNPRWIIKFKQNEDTVELRCYSLIEIDEPTAEKSLDAISILYFYSNRYISLSRNRKIPLYFTYDHYYARNQINFTFTHPDVYIQFVDNRRGDVTILELYGGP